MTKYKPEGYSTEAQLQADCTQWFWNEYHDERRMLHHNDNNSENRNKGAIKKALGVVRGVSDLELVLPMGVTFFIELKLPGETQTDEQIDFMNKLKERGHPYFIVEYFQQFKELIWNTIGKR